MTPALWTLLLLSVPRAPADAELVTQVPRPDRLSALLPFFALGGVRSALLRPESWREEAHPLLALDVTSAESLAAHGVDGRAPLTLSRRGAFTITCLSLADGKKYEAAVDARLARLGKVTTQSLSGATVKSAKDPLDRVLGASAVKGKEACAISGGATSVEQELPALAKLLTVSAASFPGFKLAAELPGVVSFLRPNGSPSGALGLSATATTLTLDGKAQGLPLAALAGPGPSPFASASPGGMLTLRLRVAKAALPGVIEQAARHVPGGATLGPAAAALAPALTGNLLLSVQSVKVPGTLKTQAARFFSLKLVLLAETTDPQAAAVAVAALDPKALRFREGALEAGVVGNVVWLATDGAARDSALAALPKEASAQAHAAELAVAPALLARGLGQVPFFEALQSPELAGLVAVSTELGPLLLGTEAVRGWLDEAGPHGHRGQLQWALKPPTADGGVR